MEPLAPRVRDALRVDVDEDVRDARLEEDARDVRAVQPGADDHDVPRERRLRLFAGILDGLRQAHGERGPGRDEERREDERPDRRGEDDLPRLAREERERDPGRREDERELPHVGEGERRAQRRPRERCPRRAARAKAAAVLMPTRATTTPATSSGMPGEEAGLEEHPDRDEEEAREQVVERRESRGDLVDVVAFAEDDPRGERAHRGRDARLLARRDHREDEDHDRAREDLAASHAGDAVEEARGRAPRDGDENRHARDRERDAAGDGGRPRPAPGDERRKEQEDRDDGEVLEEGDGEEAPAVRAPRARRAA